MESEKPPDDVFHGRVRGYNFPKQQGMTGHAGITEKFGGGSPVDARANDRKCRNGLTSDSNGRVKSAKRSRPYVIV